MVWSIETTDICPKSTCGVLYDVLIRVIYCIRVLKYDQRHKSYYLIKTESLYLNCIPVISEWQPNVTIDTENC